MMDDMEILKLINEKDFNGKGTLQDFKKELIFNCSSEEEFYELTELITVNIDRYLNLDTYIGGYTNRYIKFVLDTGRKTISFQLK